LVPSDVTSNENTVLEDKLEITPEIVDKVPAVQDAKKELIAVVAPAQDYQVKAGDTLSAIARQHKIQVSELIETNRLSDPDLIEINQNLKIPTSQASNGIGQTITIINRPPQSKTAASASNVASVFVIPPLSSANNSSSAAYTGMGGSISDAAEQVTTPAAYTGMGGSISDAAEQVTATPVDYETQVSLTNPQDLQTDIQKLRQKYYAQHRASQLMPVVNETSTVPTSAQVPAPTTVAIPAQRINPQVRSLKSVNEPINPEFRVAQAVPNSQAKAKARVATAASGLDASESIQTLRGRQVYPELPPLGE
jgi:LysM repeat protein